MPLVLPPLCSRRPDIRLLAEHFVRTLELDARDLTFEEAFHRVSNDTEGPPLKLPAGVTLEQMMDRLERSSAELYERSLVVWAARPPRSACP